MTSAVELATTQPEINMTTDNYDGSDFCDSPLVDMGRFVLVVGVGTLAALISSVVNLFAFYATAVWRRKQRSHMLYVKLLTFSDAVLSIVYVPLITVDRVKDYMESVALSDLWWMSYAPLLTIAHITKTWSCFLLLSATFERYLIASKSTRFMHIVRRRRPAIASATLLLTAVTSGAVFYEVKTVPNEYCTGVNKFTLDLTDLARSPFYGTVFRFYLRNTVTVFLPFILLAMLNAGILFTLKGQERRASLFRFASTDHKVRIRSATRMLVLVVCTYLGSNSLNVALTVWEHIDFDSLFFHHRSFYAYGTDLVSVLAVIACALRFPIYVAYEPDVRAATMSLISSIGTCKEMRPAKASKPSSHRSLPSAGWIGSEFDRLAVFIAVQGPNAREEQSPTTYTSTANILESIASRRTEIDDSEAPSDHFPDSSKCHSLLAQAHAF